MADVQGVGDGNTTTISSTSLVRDYRKGNWTVSETMILIEAKKMDDERRMKRSTGNDNTEGTGRINKPAELRWKWMEDFCWRKGCLRSQNQCNDKWDNLMRDYKKVRDYERKLLAHNDQHKDQLSYWRMEKNERKEKNLPTNMLPQIYDALVDVVEKKVLASGSSTSGGPSQRVLERPSATTPSTVVGCNVVELETMTTTASALQQKYHHQQLQGSLMASQALMLPQAQHISSSVLLSPIAAVPFPAPAPETVAASPTPIRQFQSGLPYTQPLLATVDSDTSEHLDSPAKRRRKSTDHHQHQHHHQEQQGTTSASPMNINTATISSSSRSHEVASAISKSASVIAEALLASGEREERRHRDIMSVRERRLKIEESKTEVNRQGITGLVDAINKLADSIKALASDKNRLSSSKPS